MLTGAELETLYYTTGIFGTLFFALTAATAHGAHSGGHGGHLSHGAGHGHIGGGHGHIGGGHGAIGGGHGHGVVAGSHGGAGAGHSAIGHSHGAVGGAHGAAGARGPVAGSHSAAGHGAAGGARVGAGQGGNGSNGSNGPGDSQYTTLAPRSQSMSGPMHVPHEVHRWTPVELLLAIFNPMRMASFLVFFGAFGRITQILFPWMGLFTMLVGIVAGVIGSNMVLAFFSFVYSKFQVSSVSVVEELVGHMGEVNIPIEDGRVGEITYVVHSKRFTSAAKPFTAGVSFKRGDKVMISNVENSIAYVEPWTYDFVDPAFDGEIIDAPPVIEHNVEGNS